MKFSLLVIAALLLNSCQWDKGHHKDKTMVRQDPEGPELVYWYYGEPPPVGYFKALKHVYGIYGAVVEIKEGCEVTDQQIRAISDHNKALHQSIEQRHPGINGDSINTWILKYSRRYDEVFRALHDDKDYKIFLKAAVDTGFSADFAIAQAPGNISAATVSGTEKIIVFRTKNDTVTGNKQLVYTFNTKTKKLQLLSPE